MSARCFATKHGAQWIGVVALDGREYQTEACASFDEAIAAAQVLARQLLRELREPDDAATGIAWWNQLSEYERGLWLTRAGSCAPIDAWRLYRATQRAAERQEVRAQG